MRGKPPQHVPTDQQRLMVKVMAAAQMTHRDMALALGVTHGTLQRHYKVELKAGAPQVHAQLAGRQFQAAMAGSVSAQQFILRHKFGWGASEGGRRELDSDAGSAPYSRTPEEADAFAAVEEAIRSRAGGHIGTSPLGDDPGAAEPADATG